MKRKTIARSLFFVFALCNASFTLFAEKSVTVKTLYMHLPETALSIVFDNFELDKNKRESYIEVCDIENRYLSLKHDYGLSMCYWDLKSGDKLILVTYNGVAPGQFYLYQNGKFSRTLNFGIKAINEKIKKSSVNDCGAPSISYCLPRYGTSLAVILNSSACMVFKWQNEKFVQLTDYPKKENSYDKLVAGFAQALKTRNVDTCLQYVLPSYIEDQCIRVLECKAETYICELIAGESNDDGSYVCPSSINDIKNVFYAHNTDDGFAEYVFTVELKDGRSYRYYPSFDTVEIHTFINDMTEEIQYIPYLVGAAG